MNLESTPYPVSNPSSAKAWGAWLPYMLTLVAGGSVVWWAWFHASGYGADDYWHLAALAGESYPGGPTPDQMFRFASGDPEDTRAAVAMGAFFWFSDLELQIDFWRPLAGLLHRLDYALFGVNAVAIKIHGLVWYLGLVALVGRLFRRLLPSASVASVGMAVFAMAAVHWQIVAWIAARNATVCAVFGLAALLFHLRWREDG